jgi:hypothetical protein
VSEVFSDETDAKMKKKVKISEFDNDDDKHVQLEEKDKQSATRRESVDSTSKVDPLLGELDRETLDWFSSSTSLKEPSSQLLSKLEELDSQREVAVGLTSTQDDDEERSLYVQKREKKIFSLIDQDHSLIMSKYLQISCENSNINPKRTIQTKGKRKPRKIKVFKWILYCL